MKKLLLFLFFLFQFIVCFAQYDAEILEYNVSVNASSGKLVKKVEHVIQINNRNGLDYANFSILFSKQLKITDLSVFSSSIDGGVLKKLKKKDIFDRSAISESTFYNDWMYREFKMYENKYPYIITCSYTTTRKEFYNIVDWRPVVYSKLPVKSARLEIAHPADFNLIISESNIELSSKVAGAEGEVLVYESRYQPIVSDEYLKPYWTADLPHVEIVPEQFKYKYEGSFASWEQYGNWQEKIYTGKRILPEKEKVRVDKILQGAESEWEKAKRLYHYLQDEMRYVNVSVDYGGLEPYPAEYVAANRFGDCKALSNYMVTMLQYAGLEAYSVDINLGIVDPVVDTKFPSQQFNHVIAATIIEQDTLWLECTSSINPFAYVPLSLKNRYGFLVSKDKSKVVYIGKANPDSIKQVRKYTISHNSGQAFSVDCDFILKGYQMEKIIGVAKYRTPDEQEEYFSSYFAFNNYRLNDFEIQQNHRDDRCIKVKSELEIDNVVEVYGPYKILNLPLIGIPDICSPEKRISDVEIPYSIYSIDSIFIDVPVGKVNVEQLNKHLIDKQFGEFNIEVVQDEQQLKIVREILINEGEFNKKDYNAFYLFIQGIRKSCGRLMIKS